MTGIIFMLKIYFLLFSLSITLNLVCTQQKLSFYTQQQAYDLQQTMTNNYLKYKALTWLYYREQIVLQKQLNSLSVPMQIESLSCNKMQSERHNLLAPFHGRQAPSVPPAFISTSQTTTVTRMIISRSSGSSSVQAPKSAFEMKHQFQARLSQTATANVKGAVEPNKTTRANIPAKLPPKLLRVKTVDQVPNASQSDLEFLLLPNLAISAGKGISSFNEVAAPATPSLKPKTSPTAAILEHLKL